MPTETSAQSLSVKRAEVEWHNFASFGQPERALQVYAEENARRGELIRGFREFIGPVTPFLEIGAAAGHSSYMLVNEFDAPGFALDLSADALRHGVHLMDAWKLQRAPVRVAGDAANLPFRDGSLKMVMACQMLSQFLGMERVFEEVKRVLAPGGIFLFAEEPLKRLLTLRLYRCPYYETMKPWERTLFDWGLLGYFVRDVIGAHQEESYGIRQNHTMGVKEWHEMISRHFDDRQYRIFVPERGWGERIVKRLAMRLDSHRSEWRAAKLLGGTLAAACRKAGVPSDVPFDIGRFEDLLRCPDCHEGLRRDAEDVLLCSCGYRAGNEGGVYNLLPSAEKKELYPGDSEDLIDFCLPSHQQRLGEGWHELEGVFGNKYRWIGPRATAHLKRMRQGPLRIRIRGLAHEVSFGHGDQPRIEVKVNGGSVGQWTLDRTGLFLLEADVPEAADYEVEVLAEPIWEVPEDSRRLTVVLSMLRLVPRE
ncbi:MAG: class I SAM-dependent methyltransferase [Candidatus Solibacter usitatus]|nr:class I SAM-dependent methyltransferase [Candidatus Solibacter usitatus]